MRESKNILLASNNLDKFLEFKALLKPFPRINLVPAKEVIRNAEKLGFVEKYDTYKENCIAKARVANHASHYPCLADDTGLEVVGLGGQPGVKTHRYAIPKAGQTQDDANITKLLDELKGKTGDDRKAKFLTVVSLVMEGVELHAEGFLEGHIAEEARGGSGFGYDPVFVPAGSERTLAEYSEEEKNAVSHRALAIQSLMEKVKRQGIIFARP